jgi:hypothetical protein
MNHFVTCWQISLVRKTIMSFLTVTIWILGVFPSNNGRLITRFLENLYWHDQLIPTKILVFGKLLFTNPQNILAIILLRKKIPVIILLLAGKSHQ